MVRLQGHLEVVVVEAKNLNSRNVINPYCVVELVGVKSTNEMGRTSTIEDHYNPKWLSTLSADIDNDIIEIRFIVKDKSLFRDDKLGSCSLNSSHITTEQHTTTIDLQNKKHADAGQLVVKVKLTESDDSCKRSAKSEKRKSCIPRKIGEDILPKAEFLHGKLKISIISAENLPNLDASLLSRKNKSDPFVVVAIQDGYGELYKIARTETIDNNLSPEWNENFVIDVCHDISNIVIIVYDEDVVKNDKMCSLDIPVEEFENGRVVGGQKTLYKHKTKESGILSLSIQFIPKSNQKQFPVENCIFPIRRENKVKLYQDARCTSLPVTVTDHAGRVYSPGNAWHDLYETLTGAKQFICISGWGLNASIILVRTECGNGETIGKILLDRAEYGVDVRVLLWEEAECTDHKKDTAKEFFKDSLVKVDCIPRKKRKKDVLHRESANAKFSFAHNQKFIVADQSVEGSPGLRNIVAYVGCFDLTSGRHDTPEHKLCNNGDGDQKNQFYNNLIATITKSNSKTPCHDVMCKIIGTGALDVYDNFQARWEMDAKCAESDFQLVKSHGLFLDYTYDSVDSWEVQLFRSICEDSTRLEASTSVYTYAGTRIDNSLHRAYIQQIQKADHFIYIETSNFIGSSHFWDDCNDIQCKNLIPIEITMKIIEKIKQKRSFTVYIVMSMHPEGNADDFIAQEVVHWQYHTVEMMYRKIGKAIKEVGVDTHPQDYLLFLTLGKREETDATPKLLKQLSEDAPVPSLIKHKRSMISVNSKVAIFDDEYMIIGSGNINDRSMTGNRNTELAIGVHQPRVGSAGEVSIFRKCLWAEHLGVNVPLNICPSNIQCIRNIRQLGEESLKSYLDTSQPLPNGHMLVYPINIGADGTVFSRLDCEKLPDTKSYVFGSRSKVIPASVTA